MTDADVGAAGRGRPPLACPQCGTQIAPALLACPSCQCLVHSDALKRLAAEAERTAQAGDMSAALAAWREALELLPPDSSLDGEIGAVATSGGASFSKRVSHRPDPDSADAGRDPGKDL